MSLHDRGRGASSVVLALLCGCVDLAVPVELRQWDARRPPTDTRPIATGGDASSDGPDANVIDVVTVQMDAAVDQAAETQVAETAPPDAPLLANGSGCSMASQCASGRCVDGTCCNTDCSGACQACDVAGSVGTCTPAPAGQDPDNECAEQPASTCGRDGTCDGSGACRRYPVGTQCAPGNCTGSTEYAASACTAAGMCQAGMSRPCAPNVCSGGSCASACTQQIDCQAGFFCDLNTCRPRRANGNACSMGFQCASNTCADGVCCATGCGQACHACNLAGSAGTCTAIADGVDPAGECPAQPASTCGRQGACNGRGACRLHPLGTPCGSQTCSGSTETPTPTCNGAGACQPGVTRTCPGTLCSGTACATSCTTAAQCQPGHKCVRNTCVIRKIASLTVHDTARAANWSLQTDFQVGAGAAGAHPWTDYPNSHVVSLDGAASFFLANEWVKVDAQSKMYTGGPQATVGLVAPADVYIMVDDRWGTTPAFTAGWTNTGFNIQVFENATRPMLPFSVFRKVAQTGNVTFPPIGSNTAFNYFILVD